MRSHTTRQFMAARAIMQRFGRPSTPTDQAWIESLFGHVKGDWPHLEKFRDPGELALELDRMRTEYNTVRLHAGIGYVTPTTSTTDAAMHSAKPEPTGWHGHGPSGSTTVETHRRNNNERAPDLAG
jgi:hypothetical protein